MLSKRVRFSPLGAVGWYVDRGFRTTTERRRPLCLEPLEVRAVLSAVGLADAENLIAARATGAGRAELDLAHEHAVVSYLPQQYRLIDTADGFLSGPANGRPLDIAYGFLAGHAEQLGIGRADVFSSTVADQYVSRHTGTTHIYLNQSLHGLRVANASININVTADGRVINVGSTFLPDLSSRVNFANTTALSPAQALMAAATHLEIGPGDAAIELRPTVANRADSSVLVSPELSRDEIPANLFYAPTADGGLALAWNLVLRTPDDRHWYDVGIDAANGELVFMADWIDHASYNVYPAPIEAPNDGQRAVVVDPADPAASPLGWHDTNGVAGPDTNNTTGNNVFAQEDRDDNNTGGFRPGGGATQDFDFPLNLNQDPGAYQSAAITNLFYWNNFLHDVHYVYGFDEPSGNFQLNNYGRGGAGGDPVQADAQDGADTGNENNANFGTPPDGLNPRMQMFVWSFASPRRDSDLDNQIIVHEYGHGVSNRLTGGPSDASALFALQSGGMGEGWSDWWGLMFTQKPSDTKLASYGVGTYVLGQPTSGAGIREFPYSFDMSINPQTYSRVIGNVSVHSIGEIWASALWDMNWLLIDKYGYEPDISTGYTGAGNLLALQLVMDGLKLQPANPTLLDGRDAILLADEMLTGGENREEIWTAFARRGMGLSADDGGDANSDQVFEAFDLPIFGLTVISTDPPLESASDAVPTDFTMNFSDPVLPESVDADDLRVSGQRADSFTIVDEDTILFHFDTSPVTVQGQQTMGIARGAMTRATDGEAGLGWRGAFYYDLLPMAVTGTTPAEGEVLSARPGEIVLHFNEDVSAASLGEDDLVLDFGTVTGVELLDADSVRFLVDGLIGEGTVQFTMPAGAVTDVHGTPGPEYSSQFSIDDPFIQRYRPRDRGLPIRDFETTTSALIVRDAALIADVDVELDVTHTFVTDLDAFLIAPDGTRVQLFEFVGFGGSDFRGTVFDDEATQSIREGREPFTGRFRPQEPLSRMDGGNASGTWQLEINDRVGGDEGTLDNWILVITRDPRLAVVDSTPTAGARLDVLPVDFTVEFFEAYDPATLQLEDFAVNGLVPSALTEQDEKTVTFHFDVSPVTGEGPQTMQIEEGAISTLVGGLPSAPWQAVFFYDLTPLEVTGSSPAQGVTVAGVPEIVLDFNEHVLEDSVGVDDLVLSRGKVVAAELIDADTVRYMVEGANGNGLFSYELPPGAVTDEHGSPNLAFAGGATVDNPLVKQFEAVNVPLPIVDDQTTVSELVITETATIVDLDVELDITHTFDGDLDAALVAPDGTRVVLFLLVGGSADNFTGTVLDDDAEVSINEAGAPFTGRFRPEEPLSAFDGMATAGIWRLEITDNAGGDQGTLDRWSLVIETAPRFFVAESTPAAGQVVESPPVDFAVQFSGPLDAATIDAGDLWVNGLPADAFTLSAADRVMFHYNASPVTSQGPQTLEIAAGALANDADGLPVAAFDAVFFYDAAPLRVIRTTPSQGATLLATQTEITVFFNEEIDPASVDTGDLILSAGAVTAADVIPGDAVRYTVSGMEGNGPFSYRLPAGAVTDAHGSAGEGYFGSFTVDNPHEVRVVASRVPRPIPDAGSLFSRAQAAQSFDVFDLNVELDITHPTVSDLSATLTSPDGRTVVLFFSVGGSGDDFTTTVFDDEAAESINDGVAPFTGRFRPQEVLSIFDRAPAEGIWQLTVTDGALGSSGTLNGWSLVFTGQSPAGIPGDTNADGVVDIDDLNNVRNNFGQTGHRVLGDTLPYDGVVNLDDLNAVRNELGKTVPPPPEAVIGRNTGALFVGADSSLLPPAETRGTSQQTTAIFEPLAERPSSEHRDPNDFEAMLQVTDRAIANRRGSFNALRASRGHTPTAVSLSAWDAVLESLWRAEDRGSRGSS